MSTFSSSLRLLAPLAAVVFVAGWSASSKAQVRPAADGEVRAQIASRGTFAAQQYADNGETFSLLSRGSDGSVSSLGVTFDAEVGFLTHFSLFFHGMYDSVEVDSGFATSETSGFGDTKVGAKWLATDGSLPITLIAAIKFPTGYNPDAGRFRPTLGNGVNEYELNARTGHDFESFPAWVAIQAGFRIRGSRTPRGGGPAVDYSDQIPYELEFGAIAAQRLIAKGLLVGAQSFGEPGRVRELTLAPPTENYLKLGATIGHRFQEYFQVGITYFHTVAGANALKTHELSLGVSADYAFARREKSEGDADE